MLFRCLPLTLLGIVLLGFGSVSAQSSTPLAPEDADLASLDTRARDFLHRIAQGQTTEAFRDLLAGTTWLDEAKDRLASLSSKAAELRATYGDCQDVERVEAHKIGTRLVVLRYLYLCERFPVVWHFIFYRPPQRHNAGSPSASSWQVIGVRFDTDLERLLSGPPTRDGVPR